MSITARFEFSRASFNLQVDTTIATHGVTAVFGPSGCGKTTLLRLLAGLEFARGGYLKVGEQVWQEGRTFVPTHQRRVGYVFQEASLFEHLSIRNNLMYGYRRIKPQARSLNFTDAVELLGIGQFLQRLPSSLSGGERQRVAIARALLTSPQLLLMDEPLSALDEDAKLELIPYLLQLRNTLDVPILYVSHSTDELARMADALVLMQAGSIQAAGSICEMLTRNDLPLAHREDAETIIQATVSAQDTRYHLTYLDFPGGRFSVANTDLTLGAEARIRVLARDVSLSLEHHQHSSILNIFAATITGLHPHNPAQLLVHLDIAGVPVLAKITSKSAALLTLEVGKPVYAQIKSVAVLT